MWSLRSKFRIALQVNRQFREEFRLNNAKDRFLFHIEPLGICCLNLHHFDNIILLFFLFTHTQKKKNPNSKSNDEHNKSGEDNEKGGRGGLNHSRGNRGFRGGLGFDSRGSRGGRGGFDNSRGGRGGRGGFDNSRGASRGGRGAYNNVHGRQSGGFQKFGSGSSGSRVGGSTPNKKTKFED